MRAQTRSPLDRNAELDDEARADRFARLGRRDAGGAGAKEMAMTRNPREEDSARRAEKFLEIDRRG